MAPLIVIRDLEGQAPTVCAMPYRGVSRPFHTTSKTDPHRMRIGSVYKPDPHPIRIDRGSILSTLRYSGAL